MRNLFVDLYFLIRPNLPRAFRLRVRRLMLKRSMGGHSGSWPISHLSDMRPDWWRGWPNGKKFAFVLTHDVEGRKGLDQCRALADMEMRLGFRSCFYFVPEGEYKTPSALRDFLTGSGFEVGVHDLAHDGKLYRSRKRFRRRAARINQYLQEWGAVGFRSGFTLHNLDWIRDLNILYDGSSFDTDPFEPQSDGMNTIFPFWVNRSDGSGYVELPYTLPQDSTLFLLLQESGIDTWRRKLDWVALKGGLALLNVHPDYMDFGNGYSSGYKAQIYRDLLEYVASRYGQEAWFALPKDVATHAHRQKSASTESDADPVASVRSQVELRYRSDPTEACRSRVPAPPCRLTESNDWRLRGRRAAMVMFSYYPSDPRPRRAAEALVAKGVRVDLICLTEKVEDPRHEVVSGVDVTRIPMRHRRASKFTYCLQYLAFLLISGGLLAFRSLTRGYDLVYIHNMPDILVFGALLPKVCGAKVILDLHDPMPELMVTIFGLRPGAAAVRLLKRLEKWSIALADAAVTVNRACAKLFASRSCPASKVTVVMNSPDERIFGLRPAPDHTLQGDVNKPFVIMYHGSLVERNGLDLAIDALARVRQFLPNAELRVYGRQTPFLARMMELVQAKGLQQAVKYLGAKSLEQLVPAIEACDVGIIPNHRSVFTELNTPTRIFEYLALGKPVIAPRAPGICDYFEDGSLVFFALGDARDLADKIEYVFSHPSEVAEIVRRGQAVHREHSWPMERIRLTDLVAALLDTAPARNDAVSVVTGVQGAAVQQSTLKSDYV